MAGHIGGMIKIGSIIIQCTALVLNSRVLLLLHGTR
jgi:hypothetical protein